MNYTQRLMKNCPSLLPPQDCKSIFPPKPPPPEPPTFLATNEICGDFYIPCGSSNFTVWNTTEVVPSGTVSVLFKGGCTGNLTVSVTDSSGFTDMFEVPPHNTISRTYADLVIVRLTCPAGDGSNSCTGKYCLTINYPL
jgi:hypothetical protein